MSAWEHPSQSEERQEEQHREPHVPHDHEWGDEDAGNQQQAAASEATHCLAKGRIAIHGGHAGPKQIASDRMTTRGGGAATGLSSMRNGQVSPVSRITRASELHGHPVVLMLHDHAFLGSGKETGA